MKKTVRPRENLNKGAEVHDPSNLSKVHTTDFRLLGQLLDHRLGLIERL